MITKERLEEIREKDERVFILIDDKPISAKLNSLCLQIGYVDGKEHFVLFDPDDRIVSITNEDLFETKEDAEEYIKYGNITREERLNYVSWEKFKKRECHMVFTDKLYDYGCYIDEEMICIKRIPTRTMDKEKFIFTEPLTRENYDKARDLCIKLFKGEKE